MAGFLRKSAVYLGLAEQDGEYEEEYVPVEEPLGSRATRAGSRTAVREASPQRRAEPRRMESARYFDPQTEVVATEPVPVRITTVQPTTYNEARTIGEHFREGIPVIINLTEMDDTDAKRLVDFAAGLSFGLRGTIERVTNKVFLLSPSNVTVSAEEKIRMAENGFFNQS